MEPLVPQVFALNPIRAWGAVVTSLVSMAACLYAISVAPWYLLPFAWALAGTAFTGVRIIIIPLSPNTNLRECPVH